jgi:hypothetical protein
VGPRTITPEQAEIIVAHLSSVKGVKIHLHVAVSDANDPEIGRFILQIRKVCEKAGLTIASQQGITPPIGGVAPGMSIGTSAKNPNLMSKVVNAFWQAQIPSLPLSTFVSDVPDGEVEIIIGRHP